MFGTKIHIINKQWEYIDSMRTASVPHRDELIHVDGQYKMVVNIIYESKWYGTKIFVVTEPVTTNIEPETKKS
jgi:hypothetical protein